MGNISIDKTKKISDGDVNAIVTVDFTPMLRSSVTVASFTSSATGGMTTSNETVFSSTDEVDGVQVAAGKGGSLVVNDQVAATTHVVTLVMTLSTGETKELDFSIIVP